MRMLKHLTLPKSFDLIPRPEKIAPVADGVQIMRLDEEALLIDPRYQSHPLLTFGTSFLVGGLILGALTAPVFAKLLQAQWNGTDKFDPIAWFGSICMIGGYFLMLGWVYFSMLSRAPSPILFNRKTRKVYGSYRGKVLEFDWKDMQAVTTQESDPERGANLFLAQFSPGKPPSNKTVQRGFVVTTGNLGSIAPEGLWEFMRCYMEEAPDKLPQVEIHPSNTSWTNRFLLQGPYGDFCSGEPLTMPLRERKGIPQINPFVTLLVACFWIGIPFSLWQTWVRPRTRLPMQWIPPVPQGLNPYDIILPDARDEMLQNRAALIVIAWTIACTGAGFWMWYSVVMWFRNFGQ